jgi:uncharacterized protein (DUF169 family)
MGMTDEPMKIPVNYAETSEILKSALKMTGSPVALKFAATREDIPPGIEEIEKTIRHCSMVNLARQEGRRLGTRPSGKNPYPRHRGILFQAWEV